MNDLDTPVPLTRDYLTVVAELVQQYPMLSEGRIGLEVRSALALVYGHYIAAERVSAEVAAIAEDRCAALAS